MKKILFTLSVLMIAISAVAQTGIAYGVTFGISGNDAEYVAGDVGANALFHTSEYGRGNFNFTARYFLNDHWSLQSGLGFSSIGFDFALAQDYSLLKKDNQYTQNNLSVSVLQVPVTAIYAFTPTCKNNRLFIGGGFATMSSFKDIDETLSVVPEEGNAGSAASSLDQTMTSNKFTVVTGQVMGGVEKTFKKGGILQFGLLANFGFANIAYSTVSYSIENVDYEHTFSNSGDYFGFMMTYYFRPLGGGK